MWIKESQNTNLEKRIRDLEARVTALEKSERPAFVDLNLHVGGNRQSVTISVDADQIVSIQDGPYLTWATKVFLKEGARLEVTDKRNDILAAIAEAKAKYKKK